MATNREQSLIDQLSDPDPPVSAATTHNDGNAYASVSQKARCSLETAKETLGTLQRLAKTCPYQHMPMTYQSGLARIDPLCTQRQRSLAWYKKSFGIIGLAWYIGAIAKWEIKDERSPNRDIPPQSEIAHDAAYDPHIDSTDESQIIEDEEEVDDISPDSDDEFIEDSNPRSKSNRSWNALLHDIEVNKGNITLFYLSSLHNELLDALIAGDLPSRMQDETFHHKISPYTELQDSQGVYAIYVAVARQPVQSTQQLLEDDSYVGKSLTLAEMQCVYDLMHLYIQVHNPLSQRVAKRIDKHRSGARKLRRGLDYSYQRRYGSGAEHNDFTFQTAWLAFVKSHYLEWAQKNAKGAQSHVLKQRLQRCFVYVGLASNVAGRAPNHWKHMQGTSPVFGLLVAALGYLYPGRFTLQPYTYQIFRTIDRSHIGLDEKIATILLSGYLWDGGLSSAFAGCSRGTGPNDMSFEKTLQLQANRQAIERSGFQERSIDKSLALIRESTRAFDLIQRQDQLILPSAISTLENELKLLIERSTKFIHCVNEQEDKIDRLQSNFIDAASDDVLAALQEYEQE